jgi:endonuclease/exonuclease/phosphatase family metal-dependent hydrolase
VSDVAGTKPAPGPDQPPIPVRLVTVTVRPGAALDLPRLARMLADANADVICLQDVGRGGSEDVDPALLLSRSLDMALAWEPTAPEADGADRHVGHALLSRLPVLISSVHPLPGSGGAAVQTMVELDGGALWVTAASLATGSAQEHSDQIAALAALHSEPMETGVVVGDLGAAPDAPELAALRKRFTPVDGAREGTDHVWISPGVRVTAARVLDGDAAPDRRALVVDLAVRSGV